MKELLKKPIDIDKIEFWAATSLYIFAVFLLVSDAVKSDLTANWTPEKHHFEELHLRYSYFANYFIPQLISYSVFYGSYVLLTRYLVPPLLKKQNIAVYVIVIIILFFLIGCVLTCTGTWLKGYLFAQYKTDQEVYNFLFKINLIYAFWLMMMFAFYAIIKYSAQYLLENSDKIQSKYQIISRDGLIAFVLWMIGFFLLLMTNTGKESLLLVGFVIPYGICLYGYSIYAFIPQVREKQKGFGAYLWKVVQTLLVTLLPFSLLLQVFLNSGNKNELIIVNLFNIGFQLLICAPLSWNIYKYRQSATAELRTLKTALGRSTANLDFLRSQINPHFLFNALNTLYGTALQENAERTGEGIQKLGDMMRFMLQENVQEKILLSREIEYLHNYIALQQLRTQSSPDISITTEIHDPVNALQIAPMLLIPFIENAFKHGISLRDHSHIRITLETKENTLYFDVHNSIHIKPEHDPEKNKSGIGLQNVKQRLHLLYPKRHELIIRESAKDFFIHLTIDLSCS